MIQSKVIGLTGGIASGKSTVSDYLRDKGIPIVDADVVARQVVEPETKGLKLIVEAFGQDILDKGHLNRAKLRELIFASDQAREKLNAILHPIIHETILDQIESLKASHELLVFDAPLLLENNLKDLVDVLWVVSLDLDKQVQRLMKRDSINEEAARTIISKQMPLKEKESHADVILTNNRDLVYLYRQIDHALKALKS